MLQNLFSEVSILIFKFRVLRPTNPWFDESLRPANIKGDKNSGSVNTTWISALIVLVSVIISVLVQRTSRPIIANGQKETF